MRGICRCSRDRWRWPACNDRVRRDQRRLVVGDLTGSYTVKGRGQSLRPYCFAGHRVPARPSNFDVRPDVRRKMMDGAAWPLLSIFKHFQLFSGFWGPRWAMQPGDVGVRCGSVRDRRARRAFRRRALSCDGRPILPRCDWRRPLEATFPTMLSQMHCGLQICTVRKPENASK